jgi:hypothetical protein
LGAHAALVSPHRKDTARSSSNLRSEVVLFRWLGSFSLQLYLGHYVVAWGLYSLPRLCGHDRFWTKDLHMLACYLVCYAYTQTIQPWIDRQCMPSKPDQPPEETSVLLLVEPVAANSTTPISEA